MLKYLEHYYSKYPKSTIQDYLKLFYQIEFGPGHIITNPASTLSALKDEIANLSKYTYENLYEYVGYEYVRVNLRPYKLYNLNTNLLNELLLESANIRPEKPNRFFEDLQALEIFLTRYFPKEEVINSLIEYKEHNFPIFHHSEAFRKEYQPAYRLIHRKLITEEMKFYQVNHYLDRFSDLPIAFVAIEGKSCSGKTSISGLIEKERKATIIHVDDFFDTKTNDEFGINSQRIISEIFNEITVGKSLTYKKYDCTSRTYKYCTIDNASGLVILEGVFSANPELLNRYQGIIYLDVDEDTKIERLFGRSRALFNQFMNVWLPRENQYYEKYNIRFLADLIV